MQRIFSNLYASCCKMRKTLMEQESHKWLDDGEHADRCSGNEGPYSAKERQIIITNWQVKHTGNSVEVNIMVFVKNCGLKQAAS